ncbi:MAG: GH3 auxin-responsive promoter family protein [Thermoproteota archaeon]
MNAEGELIWNKYCSFLYKDFHKQIEYNEKKVKEYFERIRNTKILETLRVKNAKSIEQVPVTTYNDYPFLDVFGEKVKKLEASIPKGNAETLAEYHMRIGRIAAESIKDYIPGDFEIYVKTSGTTSRSKWIIHTNLSREITSEFGIACLAMACSDRVGDTSLRFGDTGLNTCAPPPYISGWVYHYLNKIFKFKIYPPLEVTDRISDIKQRMLMVLKKTDTVKERIAFIMSTGSLLYMLVKYITDRRSFYRDSFESLDIGVAKLYMLSKFIHTKLFWEPKKVKEVLPVKGLICAGYDSKPYIDLFKSSFGVEPLNAYGSSELVLLMYGNIENRSNLVPDLRAGYLEFIDTENGGIFKIDEVKKGKKYSLVATYFGGCLVRYKIGDMFKVEDLRDDGMPIFSFEGREDYAIDLYGYFRIDEGLALRVMMKAGFTPSEKWCFAKVIGPQEYIHVLMENEWGCTEDTATKRIFNALLEESVDFKNFVKDFRIKNPWEIIKVEYLRKGAFMKYSNLRLKMGSPYGQMKPPRIIPTQKMEIFENLRGT